MRLLSAAHHHIPLPNFILDRYQREILPSTDLKHHLFGHIHHLLKHLLRWILIAILIHKAQLSKFIASCRI